MKKECFFVAFLAFVGVVAIASCFAPDAFAREDKTSSPRGVSQDPREIDYLPDGTLPVRLDALLDAPRRRREARRLTRETDEDHTAAAIGKKEKYCLRLKEIARDLIRNYYPHREFPRNLFEGIDKHSLVLTGIRYPFYPTTGATRYSGILAETRIAMYEHLIKEIARNVFIAASEAGVTVIDKRESASYEQWLLEWDSAN